MFEPGQDGNVAALRTGVMCGGLLICMEKDLDKYFMKKALLEAKKAYQKDEVPIGCVIVKDNKIIARGHNLRECNHSSISHAEIIAINKANKKLNNWRLIDTTMYVTLEPCPMCAGAIFNSRISRVVYASKDEKYGSLGGVFNLFDVKTLNHHIEIKGGVLEEESTKLIKEFFKQKRNKKDI